MPANAVVDEECMALEAIYGEENFTRLNEESLRVRIDPSSEASGSALFIELSMPNDYPDACPTFDLSNVNNIAFPANLRGEIQQGLQTQAEAQLGDSMIYSLVEWAREQLPEWHERSLVAGGEPSESVAPDHTQEEFVAPKEAGDALKHMTKAQKRRHFDKFGAAEEKPRGWNWIDLISHLSRGGGQLT